MLLFSLKHIQDESANLRQEGISSAGPAVAASLMGDRAVLLSMIAAHQLSPPKTYREPEE